MRSVGTAGKNAPFHNEPGSDRVVRSIFAVHERSERFAALARHPRLLAIARRDAGKLLARRGATREREQSLEERDRRVGRAERIGRWRRRQGAQRDPWSSDLIRLVVEQLPRQIRSELHEITAHIAAGEREPS